MGSSISMRTYSMQPTQPLWKYFNHSPTQTPNHNHKPSFILMKITYSNSFGILSTTATSPPTISWSSTRPSSNRKYTTCRPKTSSSNAYYKIWSSSSKPTRRSTPLHSLIKSSPRLLRPTMSQCHRRLIRISMRGRRRSVRVEIQKYRHLGVKVRGNIMGIWRM